ncbi:protein shisa-5-like [Betta splendens]|uniref:Protein shisa-5-like n=1 Tax=Betta splendens TaxID=158456 RepID=A0A6P7MJJ9_BETSP|nr:protein shisa-5-like [Betta splendens]
MASGLSAIFVLALCVLLSPCVSADNDCKGYKSAFTGSYQASQKCYLGFCCGTCNNRYCCNTPSLKLSEDAQDDCDQHSSAPYGSGLNQNGSTMASIVGIVIAIIFVLIFICCCVCPCCCLYKMCRKPRPVINSTTHTTVVTLPQHYPQQQVATPGHPAGYQYPLYQATPMQPGYETQPMPQSCGAQPTVPYQGQPFTPGPPPTYQEATCPAYPPNPMPYSQAAFIPSQTPYPLQPPAQPQFNAPHTSTDYLTQPAYNPDYVGPQPKTG